MNLMGLKKIGEDGRLTLNKINSKIKATAKNKNISLKIIQTNSESKATSYLHKNRKRFDHIIISPETWSKNGYLIMETLQIIKVPLSFIVCDESKSIFNKMMGNSNTFCDPNYIDGYSNSIESL